MGSRHLGQVRQASTVNSTARGQEQLERLVNMGNSHMAPRLAMARPARLDMGRRALLQPTDSRRRRAQHTANRATELSPRRLMEVKLRHMGRQRTVRPARHMAKLQVHRRMVKLPRLLHTDKVLRPHHMVNRLQLHHMVNRLRPQHMASLLQHRHTVSQRPRRRRTVNQLRVMDKTSRRMANPPHHMGNRPRHTGKERNSMVRGSNTDKGSRPMASLLSSSTVNSNTASRTRTALSSTKLSFERLRTESTIPI